MKESNTSFSFGISFWHVKAFSGFHCTFYFLLYLLASRYLPFPYSSYDYAGSVKRFTWPSSRTCSTKQSCKETCTSLTYFRNRSSCTEISVFHTDGTVYNLVAVLGISFTSSFLRLLLSPFPSTPTSSLHQLFARNTACPIIWVARAFIKYLDTSANLFCH